MLKMQGRFCLNSQDIIKFCVVKLSVVEINSVILLKK